MDLFIDSYVIIMATLTLEFDWALTKAMICVKQKGLGIIITDMLQTEGITWHFWVVLGTATITELDIILFLVATCMSGEAWKEVIMTTTFDKGICTLTSRPIAMLNLPKRSSWESYTVQFFVYLPCTCIWLQCTLRKEPSYTWPHRLMYTV